MSRFVVLAAVCLVLLVVIDYSEAKNRRMKRNAVVDTAELIQLRKKAKFYDRVNKDFTADGPARKKRAISSKIGNIVKDRISSAQGILDAAKAEGKMRKFKREANMDYKALSDGLKVLKTMRKK